MFQCSRPKICTEKKKEIVPKKYLSFSVSFARFLSFFFPRRDASVTALSLGPSKGMEQQKVATGPTLSLSRPFETRNEDAAVFAVAVVIGAVARRALNGLEHR